MSASLALSPVLRFQFESQELRVVMQAPLKKKLEGHGLQVFVCMILFSSVLNNPEESEAFVYSTTIGASSRKRAVVSRTGNRARGHLFQLP